MLKMTNVDLSSEEIDTYLAVCIFFAASLALGDYGIRFYVSILKVDIPHQVIAGFTEPVTTKLIPAMAVVYLHQRYNVPLEHLKAQPYWFAFLGGLSVGLLERVLYVIVKDATISVGFVIAPWMHALNAVLIAGVIFRSVDRLEGYRFVGQLLAVSMLAMGIHVFWNTWGVILVHQAFT